MTTLQDIRRWATDARPVFICGLERSGTSILQVSLARHPKLFAVKDVYETFVFLKPRPTLQDPPPSMTQAYLQGGANAASLRAFARQLSGDKPELSEADLIRTFFYFCAHVVYPGKEPLEKTPGHVRRLTRMLELFPKASVIVCTRDPVSIVASYRKRLKKEKELGRGPDEWGWLDKTAEQLVSHFEAVTAHVEEARLRWPQQVFVAPYDWITDNPEAALQSICEFAGLPFAPEVMRPKEVSGRKVDLMLSEPITKRDPDIEAYVDADTQTMIRAKTQRLMGVWETPGIKAAAQPAA